MNCTITFRVYGRGFTSPSGDPVPFKDIKLLNADGTDYIFNTLDGNISMMSISSVLANLPSKLRNERLRLLNSGSSEDEVEALLNDSTVDILYEALDSPKSAVYDLTDRNTLYTATYTASELCSEYKIPHTNIDPNTRVLVLNRFNTNKNVSFPYIIHNSTTNEDIYVVSSSTIPALIKHLKLINTIENGKSELLESILNDVRLKDIVSLLLTNNDKDTHRLEEIKDLAMAISDKLVQIKAILEKYKDVLNKIKTKKKEEDENYKTERNKVKDLYKDLEGKSEKDLNKELKQRLKEKREALKKLETEHKANLEAIELLAPEYYAELKPYELENGDKALYLEYTKLYNRLSNFGSYPGTVLELLIQHLKDSEKFADIELQLGKVKYNVAMLLDEQINSLRNEDNDYKNILYIDPISNLIKESLNGKLELKINTFKTLIERKLPELKSTLQGMKSKDPNFEILNEQVLLIENALKDKTLDFPIKKKRGEDNATFNIREANAKIKIYKFFSDLFDSLYLDIAYGFDTIKALAQTESEGHLFKEDDYALLVVVGNIVKGNYLFYTLSTKDNVTFQILKKFYEEVGSVLNGYHIFKRSTEGETVFYASENYLTPDSSYLRAFKTEEDARLWAKQLGTSKYKTFIENNKHEIRLHIDEGNITIDSKKRYLPGSIISLIDFKFEPLIYAGLGQNLKTLIEGKVDLYYLYNNFMSELISNEAFENYVKDNYTEDEAILILENNDSNLKAQAAEAYLLTFKEAQDMFALQIDSIDKATIFIYALGRDKLGKFKSIEDFNGYVSRVSNEISSLGYKHFLVDSSYKSYGDNYTTTLLQVSEDSLQGVSVKPAKIGTKMSTNVSVPKRDFFKGIVKKILKLGVTVELINDEDIRNDTKGLYTGIAGDAKAFIRNNTVFINLSKANVNDLLHEYTHLLLGVLKSINYDNYIKLLLAYASDKNVQKRIAALKKLYKGLAETDVIEELFCDHFARTAISQGGTDLNSVFDLILPKETDPKVKADAANDTVKAKLKFERILLNKPVDTITSEEDKKKQADELSSLLASPIREIFTQFSKEMLSYLEETENKGISISLDPAQKYRRVSNKIAKLLAVNESKDGNKNSTYVIEDCK